MPRNQQMARVLALVQELAASRNGLPVKQLTERFDVSIRTLYRDVQLLQDCGFPISENAARYLLDREWLARQILDVTEAELGALFLMRQLAGGLAETSVGRSLHRLWNRVAGKGARSTPLFPVGENGYVGIRSPLTIDYRPHRKTLMVIENALREKHVLAARYHADSTNQVTSREIEPGELYWDQRTDTFYLIGHCRLRDELRVFAVHRFRWVTMTEKACPRRAGLTSREALSDAFGVWRSGRVQHVVVRFDASVAREIGERVWHASQQLSDAPDGAVDLALEVTGLPEVKRWLLGYGRAARVLAPRGLADDIAAEARAMLGLAASATTEAPAEGATAAETKESLPTAAAPMATTTRATAAVSVATTTSPSVEATKAPPSSVMPVPAARIGPKRAKRADPASGKRKKPA